MLSSDTQVKLDLTCDEAPVIGLNNTYITLYEVWSLPPLDWLTDWLTERVYM